LAEAFRDFHEGGGPDEAGLAFGYIAAPPEEFIPEEWHGRLVAVTAGMWNGPVTEGERGLQPLRDAVEPLVDLYGEIPYAELQSMIDDPPGKRNWWTAEYLDDLPDDALDAIVGYAEQMPISFTQMLMVPWGGEVARRTDSALAKRDAAYIVHPFGVWEGADRDEEHIAWGRAVREVLAPWKTGGVYLNFVGDEGEDRVRAAFGDAYGRLAAVKEQYDPDNLFRGNQNIRPREQLRA
jgi:FAD/FMN-containing dehydrogenase